MNSYVTCLRKYRGALGTCGDYTPKSLYQKCLDHRFIRNAFRKSARFRNQWNHQSMQSRMPSQSVRDTLKSVLVTIEVCDTVAV